MKPFLNAIARSTLALGPNNENSTIIHLKADKSPNDLINECGQQTFSYRGWWGQIPWPLHDRYAQQRAGKATSLRSPMNRSAGRYIFLTSLKQIGYIADTIMRANVL